jgi:outer membrane protein TolC
LSAKKRKHARGHYLLAFGIALASLSGCGATLDPSPEGRISVSSGIANAAAFSIEGGPLDVAAPETPTLTLADALRRALAVDPSLQSALSRVRVAQADADQARLLPNPILDVVVRYPRSGGSPDIEAGLVADLISVLGTPWRAGAAIRRLKAAAAEAVGAALDVVAETEEAYAAVQTLDELTQVLSRRREIVVRLAELSRLRFEAGEGTRTDLVAFETKQVGLEVDLSEREVQRRAARLRLARLVGEPSSPATWAVETWKVPPSPEQTEAEWIEAALEHRPEVEAARWRLAALEKDQAFSWLSPFGTEGSAGAAAERDEGSWSVGPAISTAIPFLDFGSARRERARAEAVEARHELTLVRRRAVEEVRAAFASFLAARENVERVRDRLIPLEADRRRRAETTYLAGESGLAELLLAEEDLLAAEVKLTELERETTGARIRLLRAAGGVRPPAETSNTDADAR